MKTDARGFAALLLLCLAHAAAAQGLGLAEAFEAARANDTKYRAALGEFEGSKEYRIQGQAALGPQLSLGGSAGGNRLEQKAGSTSRTTDYRSNSLQLQLKQSLYNPELRARSREAEARSRLGETTLAEKTGDLMLRLLEAYTDVLLAGELSATAAGQVVALQEQLRSAERTRRSGEGTVTDEIEARSRLALAEAKVLESANARQDALAKLALMLGPQPQAEPRRLGAGFVQLPPQTETLAEWEALGLDRNPALLGRRQQLEIAREGVERAEALRRPRVDAVLGVYRADSDSINTVNQSSLQHSAMIQLNVPLYDGGAGESQVRQALAGVAVAEATLEEVRLLVLTELRQQYRALNGGALKVRAYREALDSATQQITATRQSVKGGIRVPLDVLNAESQRFQVQQDLTRAYFDYLKAWFRLRAAAGVLDMPDLAQIDQQLR